ncbi:MAG TPA: IS66 family insertion sequence element accessory protein TnpB [Tepidisphaeraceae bacterium]|jgi:transposase|nr:IS66 family insertion sequence element accessory protein TnpB [Tepidisphaeraceae bacterium]
MIGPRPGGVEVRVYVATAAVDGRKSFDTLCEVVRRALGHDPMGGDLFVFRNRQANRVKVLFWDNNGLVLYSKRLERGTFRFPAAGEASITVTPAELMELLAGGGE